MPHIIIEHDSKTKESVDLKALATCLHNTLAAQETVRLEAVKTRTLEIDNVTVGAGEHNEMLHVEVKLLEGRSVELKEQMALALFNEASNFLEGKNCSISVNIIELGVYKK